MSTFLFYLLILFLPTQLGKHFWPEFSYVNGIRIDYLAPTIYATDVLIFLLFISTILSFRAKSRLNRDEVEESYTKQAVEKDPSTPPTESGSVGMTKNMWLFLILVVGSLSLVTFFSLNPTLSFLKLLKIAEMVFWGWFVSRKVRFWTSQNDGGDIKLSTVIFLLSLTVFYESILAIWQFINQASVGGLWWFLGERTFHAGTPFIAQAVINNQLILRPYGTFSHPNVFGGYLAIVLTLIFAVIASPAKGGAWQSLRLLRPPTFVGVLATTTWVRKFFLITTLILGLIALFLTFSRTAWVALGMGILGLVFLEKRKKPLISIGLISLIGLIGIFGFWRFQSLLDVDQKSFFIRQQLNNTAIKIISDHPLLGVGLNNFLIALPHYLSQTEAIRFYQPVHNIFLLIGAETGIVGLLLFLWFIFLAVRKILTTKYYIPLLLLSQVLFLGLFDHYLWTLQQGQLLMALVLGLAWARH